MTLLLILPYYRLLSLLHLLCCTLSRPSQVYANDIYLYNGLQTHQLPFTLHDPPNSPCQSSAHLPSHIFNHLAQYSPWFPAGQYPPPPQDCTIDQVNILHRHSSRYPTAGAARIVKASLKRIQAAIYARGNRSSLSWLTEYRYELGSDDLVDVGIEE